MQEKYQENIKWNIILHKIAMASLAVSTVIESLQLWPLWPSVSTSHQRELRGMGHVTRGSGNLRSVTHCNGRSSEVALLKSSGKDIKHAVSPHQKNEHRPIGHLYKQFISRQPLGAVVIMTGAKKEVR